jgi:tRNA-dihydrouridine synthase
MLDETGCAGVSIGRGAFYDPWIFKRTLHFPSLWWQRT